MAEHGPVVLRVCRALLGWQEAQDAWSETFLAALAGYPQLPPQSNLRGWLITIAQRKAIDNHRRSRRSIAVASVPDTPVYDPEPADGALWSALACLPPKQRRAVAYHYVADLSYAQVGALIGTSEAAARRSAADGLAALRKRLAEGLEADEGQLR